MARLASISTRRGHTPDKEMSLVRALMGTGLAVSAVAILGLIVVDTEMGGDHRYFLTKALFGGIVLFGVGLLLAAVAKLTKRRTWGRCPRCGHAVRPGHIFCEDHFQESVHACRDRLASR